MRPARGRGSPPRAAGKGQDPAPPSKQASRRAAEGQYLCYLTCTFYSVLWEIWGFSLKRAESRDNANPKAGDKVGKEKSPDCPGGAKPGSRRGKLGALQAAAAGVCAKSALKSHFLGSRQK